MDDNLCDLNVLITGGAGYIGSHTLLALSEAGYNLTVLDNLSTGFKKSIVNSAKFFRGDLENKNLLKQIFEQGNFGSVIHFAASVVVPDSIQEPLFYYQNNVANTINLLDAISHYKVPRLVFSSSAAVYGQPPFLPLTEDVTPSPISPYGRTKLMDEWIIQDLAKAQPWFRYGILRYFNVAGSDPKGRLGQNTDDATHLIKLACLTALGYRPVLQIFGDDYATADGTGVRDFIHVSDLADVHLQILKHLEKGADSDVYNCGYGKGYSVLEVVNTVKEVSGVDFPVEIVSRRPGDPPKVVADVTKLTSHTGWRPRYDNLSLIVQTALEWEKKKAFSHSS